MDSWAILLCLIQDMMINPSVLCIWAIYDTYLLVTF
jgi:hypothetical protein